jgi:hypothetical protein
MTVGEGRVEEKGTSRLATRRGVPHGGASGTGGADRMTGVMSGWGVVASVDIGEGRGEDGDGGFNDNGDETVIWAKCG